MAAAATDKLKKYKSLFSTTLSTGIGTGTGDTLTPATVTGLPTDTGITLTLDRVDSGGTGTPTKLERITGVIAGGNLTSYVRAKDSTTEQAHTAGAVIEMVYNAADHNDMVDWGLVEHKQDGTHTASFIDASYISASAVTAGTLAASAVTAGTLTTSAVLADNITASAVSFSNILDVLDEDDMATDSAVKLATQQSIKKYVDDNAGSVEVTPDGDYANTITTSSGSYVDITGADASVTVSATCDILVIGVASGYANPGASVEAYYRLHDGSGNVGSEARITHQPGNWRKTATCIYIDAGVTGTKTYTLQVKSDGSQNVVVENGSIIALAIQTS